MRYAGVCLAFGSVLAATAVAQTPQAFMVGPPVADDYADARLALVVQNITIARDTQGRPLPPVPAGEPSPLLDRALVKEILDIATQSAIGQACGFDWQKRNFLPLMARERARGDRSVHQLAAISMLHGVQMGGWGGRDLVKRENCKVTEEGYRKRWPAAS